jgi:hypothetical protein
VPKSPHWHAIHFIYSDSSWLQSACIALSRKPGVTWKGPHLELSVWSVEVEPSLGSCDSVQRGILRHGKLCRKKHDSARCRWGLVQGTSHADELFKHKREPQTKQYLSNTDKQSEVLDENTQQERGS